MFDGDRLTQKYNYVVYHFENGGHYYWARAYLEDIDTVALFGPLDNRTTRRTVAGRWTPMYWPTFSGDFKKFRLSAMKDTG